ncbi:MAG: hypothetical protein ACTSXH_18830 [Promethearchaeota archaeon]
MKKPIVPFTTVVGSFPLSNTKENMERAFNDQINIGIDYPCYPQLVSMNPQFLTPFSRLIPELEEINDTFYLLGEFKVPDQLVALEYGKFIVEFLKTHPEAEQAIQGTKACLTGPFTLSSEILLKEPLSKGLRPIIFKEPRAVMVDWIVQKFADYMSNVAKAYSDLGVNIISIDEPILSILVGNKVWFHSEEFVIEILNRALSGIKGLPSIHVCGRISPKLYNLLLQTDVKIMDHEFRANPKNFNVFQKKDIEAYGKYLAMGTIQTSISPIPEGKIDDYIEDMDFLKSFIKKGFDLYGKENLIIKPDCGFGALRKAFVNEEFAYKITIAKLNSMVQALKEVK